MKRPTVAITGGTGFVGAQVVRRMADQGYVTRGGYGSESVRWHVDDIDCQWLEVEMGSASSLRRLVRGATAVVDCGSYRPSRAHRIHRGKRRGVARLRRLVDACRAEGVARLVYVSSPATLIDDASDGPRDEQTRYLPGSIANAHVEAKAAMEAELYRYVSQGFDAVVVIPTFLFGPGDVEGRTGRLVRAVAGRVPMIVPGGPTINIADVRDVADGIVSAMESGRTGRRYILGGDDVELVELVETIARTLGVGESGVVVSASRLRSLAGAGERLVDHLGLSGSPSLVTPLDLVRHVGPVSSQRAQGELDYRSRSATTTIHEMVDWMGRVGYLSWNDRSLAG